MNYSGERWVQEKLIPAFYEVPLRYCCGRQNSKMAPKNPAPSMHILYNPLHLSVDGSFEYGRASHFLGWVTTYGKQGWEFHSKDYVTLHKAGGGLETRRLEA